jgi:hypothetical protein
LLTRTKTSIQIYQLKWNLDFSETNGVTTVKITIKHKTLSDLEQMIQMGFKEGFTMTLNYLAQLLNKINVEKVFK